MESNGKATRQIAEHVHAVQLPNLPESVRDEARRAFLNILGCMIGGSRHAAVEIAERALLPFAGPPQATVVGRSRATDMLLAALLNGLGSAVHIYDDTHAEAMIHASGPVAASALAVAEARKATGSEFLLAFLLGMEVACRLSKAVSVPPAKGSIGWSQTGICGPVGAAVAAGRLLGLEVDGLVRAIGIATSQAAGLRAMHGSMSTPLMPGHAAQAGLRSALLAEAGLTTSQESLEHRYGFLAHFADIADPAALTDGLGDRFELLATMYKPFPCGIVIHPMIDAALALRRAHDVDHRRIERVTLVANPAALALCDRRHPRDEYEATVSLQHWTAAALVFGRAGIGEGSADAVGHPAVTALRERVAATADPAIAQDSVDLAVLLTDGRRLETRLRHCIGSSARPMTDRELEAKFEGLAEGILPPTVTGRLIAGCREIEALADVGALARQAAG